MSHGSAAAIIGLGIVISYLISLIGVIEGRIMNLIFEPPSYLKHSKHKRIVIWGGEKSNLDDYPWMAVLLYAKKIKAFCSGSIISNFYVLTAAHCVNDISKHWDLTAVRLGEYNKRKSPDCGRVMNGTTKCHTETLSIYIEEKIIYEEYNASKEILYHDIALLRMANSIEFNFWMRPIDLPRNSDVPEKLWIAGWGETENGTSSMVKRHLQVSLVKWETCETKFAKDGITLDQAQICAGGLKGKDACKGDSGGPLMAPQNVPSFVPKWTIYGIVSCGSIPCGVEDSPGIYTKVWHYLPWIIHNMRN